MTISLDVPDDVLAALQADAQMRGSDAARLVSVRIASCHEPDPLYAPKGGEEELAAIEESFRAIAEGRTAA